MDVIKEALGNLPWPPEVILSADLNVVFLALEGNYERIRLIGKIYHGIKFEIPQQKNKDKATADWFKSFAARINAQRKLQKG